MAGRKKKRGSAKSHRVSASMQVLELNNAGSSVEFRIFEYGETLGHMTIGRGSFTWRGDKRKKSRRYRWRDFARIMDREAYDE